MKVLKGTFRDHLSKVDLTGLGRPLAISNVIAINTHIHTDTYAHPLTHIRKCIHSYMRFILFKSLTHNGIHCMGLLLFPILRN